MKDAEEAKGILEQWKNDRCCSHRTLGSHPDLVASWLCGLRQLVTLSLSLPACWSRGRKEAGCDAPNMV